MYYFLFAPAPDASGGGCCDGTTPAPNQTTLFPDASLFMPDGESRALAACCRHRRHCVAALAAARRVRGRWYAVQHSGARTRGQRPRFTIPRPPALHCGTKR